MAHELISQPATALARMIRERRVSSVEVVTAHLDCIARENPRLNAVVSLDAEGALAAARQRDRQLARGAALGALHGVPLTLKDCHEVAGMRTTVGSPELAQYVPEQDSVVVAKLRAAGAVFLGRSNVAPLLGDVQSDNPVFGCSNNPWDVTRSPGGSSGGAAAAVAAGMTPLEIGSDIGGSIRIPAHCCGVFGLKPTEGRVSNHGHLPGQLGSFRDAWFMNAIGPLARTVDDLELGLRVIAGPGDADPGPWPFPVGETPSLPIEGLRLAWAGAFPGLPLASDVRAVIERFVAGVAAAGATIEEAFPDELDWQRQLVARHTLREALRAEATLESLAYTLEARASIQHQWDTFLRERHAFLAPVMMTTAIRHCPRGTPMLVDGVEQEYALLPEYCRPWNLTGHPVVVLPVGRAADGLPVGVQVVGARWRDERLLGVARALAAVAPRFTYPVLAGDTATEGKEG